ncbi:unnamed protein product [Rotaria sp. Silwood1]|nr:unnamed protein product [Rotaria sp. Silwood1]CAF1620472.1 unnamed protein product [Rotaria sp. Silwood1]CAF3763629.1 unnamed protein product [Rotaria sp. Silwood1]CAF4856314.1 unnamed protein product [Rotaria sp. Silwood1]
MSTSTTSIFTFVAQQVSIYFGIPMLIAGVIGGILNIIVFLSLQTFRQSSCAFYLTIMSIFNTGLLVAGLFSRIMISGFTIDWGQSSLFYCKFRLFFLNTFTLMSLICICLATIDQYFATCSYPRWQQWSNFKLAYRLIIAFVLIAILHNIQYYLFYNHIQLPITGKISCIITNDIFAKYVSYWFNLVFIGFLPIIITVFFGSLAYYNVRQLTYRTLPLVRRELDKQLTVMVLVQVATNFFTLTPFNILSALSLNKSIMSDQIVACSNLEHLLQIEFQTTFINDEPFKLGQLSLLSHSISYIDTCKFIFNEFIANNNKTLFIDQHTLKLIFNCTQYDTFAWELVKSIRSLSQSSCP